MNKTDLIRLVSKFTLTKQQASKIVNLIFKTISDCLIAGEKVTIQNFGSFTTKFYKSKKMYEPKRKKYISIEPRKRIKFIPSKVLINILNGKQKNNK
ncbi:MAG: HU family DNA-binding protein [Endomicrobia bacterium]|nr:HU family DNA-binding protein [Endomicrobiia bacterium]